MTDPQSSNDETVAEEAQSTPEPETAQQPRSNPWDDVIKDFQSLGQSIGKAVQGAINEEKNKEALNELRTGLENAADQVAKSIDEAAHSEQADQVKTGVQKAVDDVKDLGGKVYTDAKPAVISALTSLNAGIQKMIDRLQASEPDVSEESGKSTETEETAATGDEA